MSTKKVGYICGDPTHGLKNRECIEVTKILDGCITRITDVSFSAEVDGQGAPEPYTFIRAVSSGQTRTDNISILRLEGNRGRISFDSYIPVTIFFVDSAGFEHSAPTVFFSHREVVLRLPEDSLTQFEIRVASTLASLYGVFETPNLVSLRCCIMQIVKVAAQVDLLVPSYGYCEYPTCREESSEACEAFNNLPVFPPFI